MNRREAMKLGGLGAAAAVTGLSFETLGCNSQNIENLINVILQGTSNVLASAGQTAWSAELAKAEQALASAETTWKAGGAVAILTDALNAVEAVTAVIPLTEPYSPFIDVIVTAIESVLALLPATTNVQARPMVANAHRGRIAAFKSARQGAQQWNKAAEALPALHVAKLHVPVI